MANYCASCRSNYFKVKDEQAFIDWANTLPDVEYHKKEDKFAFFGANPDGGGWPQSWYDDEIDDYVERDFIDEIHEYLAEGEVAIFMEAGAEKLRYLVGYAVAISWTGETARISLDDIYKKAAATFVGCNEISPCEY